MARSRSKGASDGTDIIELIRSDHEAVRELFKRLEDTSSRAVKARAEGLGELRDELLPHAHAEQETLYRALLERGEGGGESRDSLLEAFEEHGLVEKVLGDLEACPPDDERWCAKLVVLKELVEHHVEEEEKETLRAARKLLSKEERVQLGDQMRARKDGMRREM